MWVVHLWLGDEGSVHLAEDDMAKLGAWTAKSGYALNVVDVRGKEPRVVRQEEEAAEVFEPVEEVKPTEVKKKDMSAGRADGAPVRARAEALCVELGLKKDKRNVGVVSEAMEELVGNYESMVLALHGECGDEKQKAVAFEKLVTAIRTKGQG